MKRLSEKFWLWLFLKAARKLGFEVVCLYNPDHDLNEPVKAVHFARSEWELKCSMRDYLAESLDA